VGLIVALCFIWTIILPGAVAYHNGVFYSGDIASRLTNGKTKDVASATIEADENNKRALINGLNELNRQLGALELTKEPSSNSIKQIIDAREQALQALRNFTPKITIEGFYDDFVNVIFLLNYLALAFLIVFGTATKRPGVSVRTLAVALATYVSRYVA
jgi:hypothetical protein